jgi:hypothetical protein
MTTDKAHEARLRRKAARRGLELRRSRTRDEDAPDFGKYRLYRRTFRGGDMPVTGWLDLAAIEEELRRP